MINFLIIISIFLAAFFLTFILQFIIEHATTDSLNKNLIFSIKFYKSQIFNIQTKLTNNKPELICYFIYLLGIFLLFFFTKEFSLNAYLDLIILIAFFVAAIIDIKTRMIPDLLIIFLLIHALLLSPFNTYFLTTTISKNILSCIIGGISAFIIMLFLYHLGRWIFKQEAIGFGDVKLFTVIGCLFGLTNFFMIFFYSFMLSGIFSLFLLIIKKFFKKNLDNTLPFIPFISISVGFIILNNLLTCTVDLFCPYLFRNTFPYAMHHSLQHKPRKK